MSTLNVLVIDDELAIQQMLSLTLARAGYFVDRAGGVAEATCKLKDGTFDVALCDIQMPDGNGIDLVHDSRAAGLETVFIMITAFASVDTALKAMHAGAADYVIKPVRNEEILQRLANLETLRRLSDENRALRKAMEDRRPRMYQFTSPAMLEVERLVSRVATVDSTVLITGESGTGKGVVARAIHQRSRRSGGPFLLVNCSAIPENLVESEFFGHTKGAFTGADRARKGLFLEATEGTLFLDEIGDLPPAMQVKLLNVLEDKEARALGSEVARKVNARVIAATNCNLAERVREGRFREDLYFRLSMFEIHTPPLRERRQDLPGLIGFLLRSQPPGNGAPQERWTIDALAEEVLLAYPWPGNVRELENTLSRARLLAEGGRITIADLPAKVAGASLPPTNGRCSNGTAPLRDQMRRMEADLIRGAIDAAHGDRKLAAYRLGIALSTLYRKIEEFQALGMMESEAPVSVTT